MELNIRIGGAAGQGMETLSELFGKGLSRLGYGVYVHRDYMSRVRGGHNFVQLRIDPELTPRTINNTIDLLVCLNEDTFERHQHSVRSEGAILFDPEIFKNRTVEGGHPVRFSRLAQQAGDKIMSNTVALGALLKLIDLDLAIFRTLFRETFTHKPKIIEPNIAALEAGYGAVEGTLDYPLTTADRKESQLFVQGNQVLGMSALGSGCQFVSAYPMTPASSIIAYLAQKQGDHPIVIEQAEDEIAAINMVLGASFSGVRAMTATSGGGFSLMTEGLSLSGMTETPAVIILGMRPGPATGLPTRTEQGDLQVAVYGGHGEFPRAVLSATSLTNSFVQLNRAFDLAYKYQIPVVFLSDQYFADSAQTVPPFDFSTLKRESYLMKESELTSPYRRYEPGNQGVSPRARPGQFPGEVVLADSDEHDANGYIIEDAHQRKQSVEKRLAKGIALASEVEEPSWYGSQTPEVVLLGWGSTFGAIREASETLHQEGHPISQIHFSDLWPLPTEMLTRLENNPAKIICIENNATGQFARLLQGETGIRIDYQILKYDGRPFDADTIIKEVLRHV